MRKFTVAISALALVTSFAMAGKGESHAVTYEFNDTTLTDDQRLDALMPLLTLDEKIELLSTNVGVPRLGIASYNTVEGLHGLSLGGPGKDYVGEVTTSFPQAYGLGETWDPELIERVAAQSAYEARYYAQRPGAKYHPLVMLAPNADLARDPRWGRTEESFGEDPYLTATMTVAKIKGLQGPNPRYWRVASLMKHFLANSNEFGRDSTSSDYDSRLFRDYYSYPFYKGITEGGSRAFMAAYNAWNGIPMSIHPCLDSITRQEWGNDGIICTDGGALGLLITGHKSFPTRTEGAAAIVKSSIGMFLDKYKDEVRKALDKGLLSESDIDRAIRGNLKVSLKLGMLDGQNTSNPYRHIGADTTGVAPWLRPETKALVREVTAKSMVLLKNGDSIHKALLPLDLDNIKKIAVVGPYGDQVMGAWYSGRAPYTVTVVEGLRNALEGKEIEVTYVEDNRMDKAEKAAREADVVIACLGNHPYGHKRDWFFCPVPSEGREAVDRRALNLPDEDLLRQLMAANPNTILLLTSGFPYAINWAQENVPSILHVTHCSQEHGNGVADVLLGHVNPAGRTTQTWPRDILHLPRMMDYDIRNGHTYMYYRHEPLYPFGYGLSYTTFDYKDLKLSRMKDGGLAVDFTLTNTGDRDGEEVAQVYVNTTADSPMRLKGFERVGLKAGESRRMHLEIPRDRLGSWSEAHHAFYLEPSSKVTVSVGASSADLRLSGEQKL